MSTNYLARESEPLWSTAEIPQPTAGQPQSQSCPKARAECWCMSSPCQIRNTGPLSQPEYMGDRNQCVLLGVTEYFGCHMALLCRELMDTPSPALVLLLASKFLHTNLPSLRRLKYVEKQWYWVGKHRIRTGPHPICVIREYLLHLPGPPFLSSSVWRMCVKHCVWGNVCALRSPLPKELPPKWFCGLMLKRSCTSLTTLPFMFSQINLTIQSKQSLKVSNNVL